MRILYIIPISWGGVLQYTAELANAVSKHAEVIVMKPKDSNDHLFSKDIILVNAFDEIKFSRAKMRTLFTYTNLKSILSMRNIRLIEEFNPEIIHLTAIYPQLSLFLYIFGFCKRYNVVCTLHGVHKPFTFSREKSNSYTMALINLINDINFRLIEAKKLIVHSLDNRESLIKLGYNPNRIIVLPLGILSVFANYIDSTIQDEANNILFFGYLVKTKGLEYLMKAIPIVAKEIPDIKLIIAGEGDFSGYMEYIYDDDKFEIYNNYIPDEMVAKLFHGSKLIVLPYTYHEGHSGVLTVAFSFGKPIIATKVGDLPSLIGNDDCIVDPKDPKAIAERIIAVLKNKELREKMCKSSIKKSGELSWDNLAHKYIEIYEGLY